MCSIASSIKVLKNWHLMCVVGAITGFGVLLIVAKTIAQAMTSPRLVTDFENPEGVTVISPMYSLHHNVNMHMYQKVYLVPFHHTHTHIHTHIHRAHRFWKNTVSGSATNQAPPPFSLTSSSSSTWASSSWSASSSPSRPAKSRYPSSMTPSLSQPSSTYPVLCWW